jgi:hypothetical protein
MSAAGLGGLMVRVRQVEKIARSDREWKKRCACRDDLKRFMIRSRRRVD